jgi:hypothetical protein
MQYAGECWIGKALKGSDRCLTEVLTRHLSRGTSLEASIRIADVSHETRTERLRNTNQKPCPYGILLGHNSFKISTHFIPVYDLCNDAVSKAESVERWSEIHLLLNTTWPYSWTSCVHIPEYYVALLLNMMWAYFWTLRGPALEHHVGILLNITWSCSWISCGHTPEHYVALLLNIMWEYSWTLRGPAPEYYVGILLNIIWPCFWIWSGHASGHHYIKTLIVDVNWTLASLYVVDVGSASDVS